MINIQPFLDRLEELKDHMDFYIEVLHASHYFKGIHIIEERADFKIKYINPYEVIPLSDDGSIKKHLDLINHLKQDLDDWINGNIGIPEDKMGKPYIPDRVIAMGYSLMAAKQTKK